MNAQSPSIQEVITVKPPRPISKQTEGHLPVLNIIGIKPPRGDNSSAG